MTKTTLCLFIAGMLAAGSTNSGAQTYPFQDTSLSFHERAKNLVSLLTLDEKINQVGHKTMSINRNGISVPGYNYWNEALHGVARSGLATSFPESKGMSSTWDRQLIYDCAWATSDEARVYNNTKSKGLIYWCPTINMSRDPRWGRDEENYGEDPFLTGELAVQYIKGMQGDDGRPHKFYKTIATVKHFAANNYEKGRHNTSSEVSDKNLREYYLPAFEKSVNQANVRSVMSAYNALNGVPCCANNVLLNDILRGEWGFNGFVTSDCGAIDDIYQKHHYVATAAEASASAIINGEDLNCGNTFQDYCKEAIEKGYMTEADLDSALTRVFEARFSVGEFDDKASVDWTSTPDSLLNCQAHKDLAYKAAQEAIVLLKNDNNTLPLSKNKSVAVIGPLGNTISLGGYSGSPTDLTTPLQGIAEKMNFAISDGTIQFEDCDEQSTESGSKRLTHEANGSAGNIGYVYSGDWLGYHHVNLGNGCSKLSVYSGAKNKQPTTMEVFLDSITDTPAVTLTLATTGNWSKYAETIVDVDPNVFKGIHDIYTRFTFTGNKYGANLDWFKFYNPDDPDPLQTNGPLYFVKGCNVTGNVNLDIDKAVEIAKKADVVVMDLGTDLDVSDESHDRTSLALPGNQQTLLERVYAANPNIVLILQTCSSVDISWAKEHVPAIIEAWYGGQAQGKAIADVLFGDYNPSGKLTSTWYASQSDLPSGMLNYNIDDAKYTYMYYDKTPQYPFGYGLSYTTFEYSDLSISPKTLNDGDSATITFNVKNTGTREGTEIVQLYTHTNGSLGGQIKQLNGFDRVELQPSETKTVTLKLGFDQMRHYNESTHSFDVEGGAVDILVGASSDDIRLRGQLNTAEKRGDSNLTGIEYARNNQVADTDKVYNAAGFCVGSVADYKSLPKGFYIVRGEKYLKH